MSDSSTSKPRSSKRQAGILAGLSNTRPQRPSARRASVAKATKAARPAPRSATPSATKSTKRAKPTPIRAAKDATPVKARAKAKAKVTQKPTSTRESIKPLAPRQGFEAGSEIELGQAVGPPSGIELAGSVVGLLGEAAQAGIASGGRLLKGAVSRLPGL